MGIIPKCIVTSILFLLLFPLIIYASGFQLKTVGTLNVDGVTYKQLWYSSGNVTFTGISPAGTEVTATIDSTANTATVDSDGNWTYTATLADGDHTIAFSSTAGSISFTLTIGPVPEGVAQLTQSEVPTSGTPGPSIAVISTGGMLVVLGMALLHRKLKYTE